MPSPHTTASNPQQHILILGLGELGTSILDALLSHPSHSLTTTTLTVTIRPSTISSPSSTKAAQLAHYTSQNVNFQPLDIEAASTSSITATLVALAATTVIHAGGMTLAPGTQLKLTRAVLAAPTVSLYLPWQYGVDYDVIGREAGGGLFAEQLDVRDALRVQSRVQWLIVSCGVFMSFLLEQFWGVVVRDSDGGRVSKVRALGGWEHVVTATEVGDIGRVVAELVVGDGGEAEALESRCVYIAGESMTYSEFVDSVERCVGVGGGEGNTLMDRELWTTEELKSKSSENKSDKLLKYRVVFSEDRGLAWPVKGTYNERKGMKMMGLEEYIKQKVAGGT